MSISGPMNDDPISRPDLTQDSSFEAIFRTYFPGLRNYAMRFAKNGEEAEEIVQEVFVQLWEKRDSIQLNTSIKSYLFRAVHNRCLNQIRNEKIRARHHDHIGITQAHSEFSDAAIEQDIKQQIYEAIGQLPEQCGRIFKLSRFEGLSYKEIAARLDISPKTVEVQMGKALKRLRISLRHLLAITILIAFLY